MSELVSILIPAFNAERWVGRAIESALAQSWPSTEVIVVDDGSTDRTLKVARQFASRGVRVATQTNRGAAATRNTALAAARGSYLQFLDADDLLHPDKIATQLYGAKPGLKSATLLTGAWGRFLTRPEHAVYAPGPLWQSLAPVDWLLTKFTANAFMFPASWLVSRHLIDAAGRWDESLSLDDDGEYACRLVAASDRVTFVERAISLYRIGNTSSLSSQRSAAAKRSLFRSLRLCTEHLLTLQDSERTRSACLVLLQENLRHFHPEYPRLADAMRRLAFTLGGALVTPEERLRFRLARHLIGSHGARACRQRLANAKLALRRSADRLPRFQEQSPWECH